jgi:hypothetical protein
VPKTPGANAERLGNAQFVAGNKNSMRQRMEAELPDKNMVDALAAQITKRLQDLRK